MIEVNHVSKSFDLSKAQRKELATTEKSVKAVDDVSFSCEPGKVHGLLGANGAGKTTTLRMISTIFKPTEGSIIINGIDAVKNPNEARKQIGFLTGSAGLYARLTPNELIHYFGGLYGVDKQTIDQRKQNFLIC